jgi:hypothetical protein
MADHDATNTTKEVPPAGDGFVMYDELTGPDLAEVYLRRHHHPRPR